MAVVQRREIFNVRRATSLDDLKWVIQMAVEEGWRSRAVGATSYFTAGIMQDFFIGELNGERISCISLVSHGETNAFVGYFVVVPSCRGKGYGIKTWKAAFENLGTDIEFRLYSVVNMQDKYTKFGFQPGWIVRRYTFTCDRAADGLSGCKLPSSVAEIVPGCQANFEKLVAYGTDMVVSSQAHKLVLAAWLSNTQESSWVAIGNKGEVLGYLIMAKTLRFPEEGFRLAPFYADSAPIARSLLKMAVEYATLHKPECLFLDLPKDFNIEGDNIVNKELEGEQNSDFVFMGTKGIPNIPLKVFGFASVEVM